jgi:signal-transduction protein with cAMP-binding, CBS, and nucleotidyltransferase domain
MSTPAASLRCLTKLSERRIDFMGWCMMETIATILAAKGGEIWAIPPESSVFEAIALMAEKQIGALLVMSGSALLGIISERDYARKVILQERSSKETRVSEIMTCSVVTVEAADTVEECMRIMTQRRIRHLPVLESGQLVGLVSIGDLVKALVSSQAFTIQQLESLIAGRYPV